MHSTYKGWQVLLTPKADTADGRPHNDILLKDPTGLEFVRLSDGSTKDSKILAESIIDELEDGYTRKNINNKYKGWQITLTAKANSGDGRPHNDILLKDPTGLEFVRLSDGSNEDSKILAKSIIDSIDEVYRDR
ncbi:hypothetical protein [Candidatus Cyanaurora vandensis]|uniref:hypothetical protein n=1 Tax=Candidatus Cyanaurora vandensis TaxID=2714958 RepID=UPI00257B54E1|nr:hypothetical protein [Candidatus Cyanaurora vandensis]